MTTKNTMDEITINQILPPISMLAELTYRCPLQCPYCSNPLELLKKDKERDTVFWKKLFKEAAKLGVLQVHLSGGEPTLRQDLIEIVDTVHSHHIYANLITAGTALKAFTLPALKEAGLDHVQLSLQGADADTTSLIANYKGAYEAKLKTAKEVRQLQLPLTLNAPIHRYNIDQLDAYIALALELDAERIEIANVQYSGWALLNRNALMPKREDFERQMHSVAKYREKLRGILNIDYIIPDYFADYPKPCMGGFAKDAFVVTPDGAILPCHAAQTIKTLEFKKFDEYSLHDIWYVSHGFNAYRGTEWMQEPCRSCDRREIDFGGCRCQALALMGDASATDPACIKSIHHAMMKSIGEEASRAKDALHYRKIATKTFSTPNKRQENLSE